MGKDIQKKMAELMEVFVQMSKDNLVLSEVNELNKQMKELVKIVAEKKWDASGNIYEMVKDTFNRYKDHIDSLNKNKEILKRNMSKLKELYKDEISKKIKEAEAFKISNDAFELAKNTFKNYKDSIEMMNKQFEYAIDAFKEIKDTLKSEKSTEKPKTTEKKSAGAQA